MSHIVTIRTKIRDRVAIEAACRRLELPEPIQGTATLFEGEVSGLLVRVPGWVYPVVVDTATGETKYDNYEGAWGKQEQLDRFLQTYAIEKAKLEARKSGHSVSEQTLQDGSVKLQIFATS